MERKKVPAGSIMVHSGAADRRCSESMITLILTLLSILLSLVTWAVAADIPSLPACTKKSLATYRALAKAASHSEKEPEEVWDLPPLDDQAINPLISIAKDPTVNN